MSALVVLSHISTYVSKLHFWSGQGYGSKHVYVGFVSGPSWTQANFCKQLCWKNEESCIVFKVSTEGVVWDAIMPLDFGPAAETEVL